MVPKASAAPQQRQRRPGRITSWNYAGTTLFYGLVGGPALLVLAVMLIRSGPMNDPEGKPDWVGPYFFATILSGITLFLVYRAFTKAVLWIDIGRTLCVRKLVHSVSRSWDDIENIDFEAVQGRMPLFKTGIPGIGLDMKFDEHRILVIRFRDQSVVRLEVKACHDEIVQELTYRHLEARHYREQAKAAKQPVN